MRQIQCTILGLALTPLITQAASSVGFNNTYNCSDVRGVVMQDSSRDTDEYLSDFTLIINDSEIQHNDPGDAGMTYSTEWTVDKVDRSGFDGEVIGALALPKKGELKINRAFDEVLLLEIYEQRAVRVVILNNTRGIALVTEAYCQSLTKSE